MTGDNIANRSYDVRPAVSDDLTAVLALLRSSLGWRADDPYEELYRWKHVDGPFGRSPAWVAEADGEVIGFRTFMRWEFRTAGGQIRAVRAVDTATAPDFRGRGVFSTLTRAGVEALASEGVDIVFNTPNDQSRPGYLKLGWSVVGQLPVGVRPRSAWSMPRILRARVPAELWSMPCDVGFPASVAFADDRATTRLLDTVVPPGGTSTRRSPAYLRWRYGLEPLHYRVVQAGRDLEEGAAVFRLRRRGAAVEAALAEVLVPEPRAARWLVREVLRRSVADYAVALRSWPAPGLLPLPGQGPLLTVRPMASTPPATIPDWRLSLGDVELF